MHRTIQAQVYKGDEGWYGAEAVHLNVATQGKTLDETIENLREALSLHLEDEDPAETGIVRDAPLLITFEMEPVYAAS